MAGSTSRSSTSSKTSAPPTTLPEHFSLTLSDIDKTGLQVVSVHDARTGFWVRTALSDPQRQVPAIMAFAGARYSRSALSAEELLTEINVGKKSAQEKLANIFVNYGHASVGDMAMLFAYIEQIPRHLLMHFWTASCVGSGQERSSRYQDFSASTGPNWEQLLPKKMGAKKKEKIIERATELFKHGIAEYSRFLPIVTERFAKHYKLDTENKSHVSAMQARVFDTVRAFLPLGARTSAAYITSSREWARLIQWLKSDISPEAVCLGEQLELLFAPPAEVAQKKKYLPEAPDLIRHTQPDQRLAHMLSGLETAAKDLLKKTPREQKLKHHQQSVAVIPNSATATQKYLFLSLVCLRPLLTWKQFAKWEKSLTDRKRKNISKLLFGEFTHHNHLPHWSRTGGLTLDIEMTISEAIDFNRHRAWGRFTSFLESDQTQELLTDGFITPAYLDVKQLQDLRDEFSKSLKNYYSQLQELASELPEGTSPHFIRSLLPNAQRIRYFMTGGPKELSYMTQLRVRPGGHINYRVLAYEMALAAAQTDPLLAGADLGKDRKPDPANRTEFFDRS